MSNQQQSRVAIKFGSKKPPSGAPPPSSLGKRHRASGPALHHGSDSEGSDDEKKYSGKHEAITGFGEDGAETRREKPSNGPRTIERLANGGGWHAQAQVRRQRQREEREKEDTRTTAPDQEEEPTVQYGLIISEKKSDPSPAEGNASSHNTTDDPSPALTADEEAMDALLGKRPAKSKTILRQSDEQSNDAPDVSTIEEYEDTPIDDFGAALLRGMGWNGEKRSADIRERKRRPNTMGLGSKEFNTKDELGAWDNKGGSLDPSKKSRPTLEQYRKEETKKKERRGRGEDDHRRDRDDRERNRDRDRDRERDRDRDHHRNRDRDRRDRDAGYRDRDRR